MTPLVLVSQLATPVFSAAVVYAETTEPALETETDVGVNNCLYIVIKISLLLQLLLTNEIIYDII